MTEAVIGLFRDGKEIKRFTLKEGEVVPIAEIPPISVRHPFGGTRVVHVDVNYQTNPIHRPVMEGTMARFRFKENGETETEMTVEHPPEFSTRLD